MLLHLALGAVANVFAVRVIRGSEALPADDSIIL